MPALPKEIAELYPYPGNWFARNGIRIHYLDEGKGDPILMLHGNPTWSFYFRELVAGLKDEFRIVAPDHVGCGLSDKPDEKSYGFSLADRVADLEALMAHLEISERLTLLVHDWGGMIGMAYALRHPETVCRIVVTNTAGFFPPKTKGLPVRLGLLRRLPGLARPAVLGLNLFARGAVWMAPRHRLQKTVKAGLLLPYDRPKHRLATLRFVQDIPVVPTDTSHRLVRWVDDHLDRLRGRPMLICWGRHDFVFDMDYFAEWRRRFPDAETHVFDHAGHYLLEDEPRAVLVQVRHFLNRHPIDGP